MLRNLTWPHKRFSIKCIKEEKKPLNYCCHQRKCIMVGNLHYLNCTILNPSYIQVNPKILSKRFSQIDPRIQQVQTWNRDSF